MKKGWPLLLRTLLVSAVALASCTPRALAPTQSALTPPAPEDRTLAVFAAASLTDAFSEIGKAFEAVHPGVKVVFNFAGSQNLRAQIEEGASADVFASANSAEMSALMSDKLVQEGAPQSFLTNQLVVVLPADNPAGISSLADLARPSLKVVLATEEVPAGKYARQILTNLNATLGAHYADSVLANVASNENDVRGVVAKVQLGEADAGIVYVSDAVAAPDLQKIDIPADANVIARYLIAPLAQSTNPELSRAFIDHVTSAEGQAILRKWGFTPAMP